MAQQPLPHPIPQFVPIISQGLELVRMNRPLVDKIHKHGNEEFRGTTEDNLEKVKFWLENIIRVFDELSCFLVDSLKCVISLLKDSMYQWWNTLIAVIRKDRVN